MVVARYETVSAFFSMEAIQDGESFTKITFAQVVLSKDGSDTDLS